MNYLPYAARAQSIGAAILVMWFATAADAQKLRPETRVSSEQSVGFDVFLPLQNMAELDQLLTAQQTVSSPGYHK